MANENINIELSREKIRNKLINYYADLLQIDRSQLDYDDTSFSSFVINALSVLTSDVLVYASMISNESNLVTATTPEAIINWSKYIDYYPNNASAAQVSVLIKVPVDTISSFVIPKGHRFYAQNIVFITKTEYKVDVTTNGGIKVTKFDEENNIYVSVPYTLVDNQLTFIIDLEQIDIGIEEFTVSNLDSYEFYSKTIEIPEGKKVTYVEIYVNDEKWNERRIINSAPLEKSYEWFVIGNKLKIAFGNNLYGRQPQGLVRAYIYYTDGSSGNVGPGSINKGDPIYTDTTPPKRVEYKVTNVQSASGGTDGESLLDIKRNASRSLSMLNRVVTKEDYENIFKILFGENYFVKPLLKRGDIIANDILLYTTITHNGEIVPTNTIYIPYDPNVDLYTIYSTFIFENEEWIIPFYLEIDHNLKIAKYIYIPKETILDINEVNNIDSSVFITNGKVIYDVNTDSYTIELYVSTTVSGVLDQKLSLRYYDKFVEWIPTSIDAISNNYYKVTYTISRSEMKQIISIDIYTYLDGVLKATDSTVFQELTLENLSYSYIEKLSDGSYVISDVPVILKSWFDGIQDKDNFLFNVVGSLLLVQSQIKHRMINTNNSVKFVKTYGKLNNLQLSSPDYYVQKIVHSSTEIDTTQINAGDIFAISDPVPSNDVFYKYAGYLVIWNGVEFVYIKPGIGTTIYNYSDLSLYTTDGRRWLIPDYNSPLSFDIEVYVKKSDSEIYNQIIDLIVDFVNNKKGIEESLYLSELYDLISSVENVSFVRIVQPYTDIIYKNVRYDKDKDTLVKYTPELYYTSPDKIRLEIRST